MISIVGTFRAYGKRIKRQPICLPKQRISPAIQTGKRTSIRKPWQRTFQDLETGNRSQLRTACDWLLEGGVGRNGQKAKMALNRRLTNESAPIAQRIAAHTLGTLGLVDEKNLHRVFKHFPVTKREDWKTFIQSLGQCQKKDERWILPFLESLFERQGDSFLKDHAAGVIVNFLFRGFEKTWKRCETIFKKSSQLERGHKQFLAVGLKTQYITAALAEISQPSQRIIKLVVLALRSKKPLVRLNACQTLLAFGPSIAEPYYDDIRQVASGIRWTIPMKNKAQEVLAMLPK